MTSCLSLPLAVSLSLSPSLPLNNLAPRLILKHEQQGIQSRRLRAFWRRPIDLPQEILRRDSQEDPFGFPPPLPPPPLLLPSLL